MKVIDFNQSFLWWRVDTLKKPPTTASAEPPYTLNNARVPLDCYCRIDDKREGGQHSFALGASCKTEAVGAEQDIWLQPNADFKPVMSDTQFLGLKTYERVGMEVPLYPPELGSQPERQLTEIADAMESARVDVTYVDGETIPEAGDVVEAILDNRNLVGRTIYEDERYRVQLDYPFKTVNANERDGVFQPDTGPVLVADLSREPDDLLAGMELAYVAFNKPDWVEFLVRVPTPVSGGDVQVYHYARSMRLECTNEVTRVGGGS